MAHTPLTTGALARICQGEEVTEPVLQVLGNKAIAGGGTERFRLLLNDGQYSNSFSMLATQLNHLVHDNQIPQFSVIKLKQHVYYQMVGRPKRVVIVMDLEILHRGETVGVMIGNPFTIGYDGKVPPLKETVKEVLETVRNEQEDKFEDLKKGMKRQADNLEELKAEMKKMKQELALARGPLKIPECVICLEELRPPLRIVQCIKGHKVCEPCSKREEEVKACPTCRTGFLGRDYGMEIFVRQLLGEQE